nr:MAG TPA: hypothetical protein [Caudoviricetes sp.]DAH93881.1 MAG TPA: hypothetical protein [Caudoviricetes sp.]
MSSCRTERESWKNEALDNQQPSPKGKVQRTKRQHRVGEDMF